MSEEGSTRGVAGLLAVGRILRPHGIRGAVVVESLTDSPARFEPGSCLLLSKAPGEQVEVTVDSGAPHKGRFLVTLRGIADRNAAEALRGLYLMIRERDASPLAQGEFWAHELLGLKVVREGGEELGEVGEVLCRQAQDLLVVVKEDGGGFDIPFVEEFVREVDVHSGTITVALIEGIER